MAKNQLIALEAAAASITTACVTIKALRVNSRQLTMGTFRQLPRRDLVDEHQVALRGLAWGWVNYDPDRDGKRQFVAQFGEELCRCPVRLRDVVRHSPREDWTAAMRAMFAQYEDDAANYVIARVIHGCEFTRPYPGKSWLVNVHPRPFVGGHAVDIGGYGSPIGYEAAQLMRDALWPRRSEQKRRETPEGACIDFYDDPIPEERVEAGVRKAREKLAEMLGERTSDWARTPPEWEAHLDAAAREIADYAERWNALMGRLRSVEQLFIAT